MRFWEIAQPPGQNIKVEATHRFMKELPSFIRDNAGLASKLFDFIEFRKTNPPSEPYNTKDNNFNSPDLATKIKHVHLIHGMVVVFYKMTTDVLYLYTIMSHSEYYGQRNVITRMVNWFNHVKQSDFATLNQPSAAPEQATLSTEEIQEIKALLWDMASDPLSRSDLEKATRGDFKGMIDFLVDLVPVNANDLIEGLGGMSALQKTIKDILSHTQQK